MERRNFIKSSAAVGLLPAVLNACSKDTKSKNKGISAFIFSDAHIGWDGKDQPLLSVQADMIQRIRSFFPDLDLVFDTGDVHHGNLREADRRAARSFWLTNMAGQFSSSLFHYIPGNHELGRGLNDAELTVGRLGSMGARPYYSFDYKGIHFVSLPQLLDTILISEETINWLAQDLLINADKTTLIFSHNSISGTTFSNGESGYRETVNSDKIIQMMDNHGQVLAWFHGHNHQYQIVSKHQRLYVSNGRIGGFNPPNNWGDFGQGHLGGVYFHIDAKGLNVRCFSASANTYFDQIGFQNLSQRLETPTTYDPKSSMNYYFGHGRISNNVNYQFYNHYLSSLKSSVVISQNKLVSINENSSFNYSSKFYFAGRDVHRVIGFQLLPKKTKFATDENGLNIIPDSQRQAFKVKFPVEKYKFKKYLSRSGYYRCALGEKLLFTLKVGDANPGIGAAVSYKLLSESHVVLYNSDQQALQIALNQDIQTVFELPSTIAGINNHDKVYIFVELSFNKVPKQITIQKIQLSQFDTNTANQYKGNLYINDVKVKTTDYGFSSIQQNKLFNLGTGHFKVDGTSITSSLHIKVPDVKWQIRNAVASFENDTILIEALRSDYQTRPEIIITPTSDVGCYVEKLINIKQCKITYENNQVFININHLHSDAELIVFSKQKPITVTGGQITESINNLFKIVVSNNSVKLNF